MTPKFLGGDDARRRRARTAARSLAKWLASPENPYFATQPGQPRLGPLLRHRHHRAGRRRPRQQPGVATRSCSTELGKKFTEYKYDFKKLVRDICTSRTYQLSTAGATRRNAGDTRNFAHANAPPHPGRDAARLHQPGDRDEEQVPRPAARRPRRADRRRRRQHLLPDDLRPRDARDGLLVRGASWSRPCRRRCTCSTATRPRQRIQRRRPDRPAPGARRRRPSEIIEELYVRCLSRKPTPEEMSEARRR